MRPGTNLVGRGLLALAILSLAACEPSGPGALTASVHTPAPTGAVVVEVAGAGVTGFEGTGDVRTFSGPVDPRAPSHRVIVVSASGERIRFRIEVEDVQDPAPTASVVSAVDANNLPIGSLGGFSVSVAR